SPLLIPSLLHPPLTSPLFPYTTLFRSLKVVEVTGPRIVKQRIASRKPQCQPIFDLIDVLKNIDHSLSPLADIFSRWIRIPDVFLDRKSTRLNSSHVSISYAVFCLKKKN